MDVVSVTELSPGLKDREVLDLAGREGRIMVASDKDFGELVVRESKGANPAEVRAKVPAAGSREDLAGTEVGNPAGKPLGRREGAHRPGRQTKALSPPPRKEPARWKHKSGPGDDRKEDSRAPRNGLPPNEGKARRERVRAGGGAVERPPREAGGPGEKPPNSALGAEGRPQAVRGLALSTS